MKAFFVCRYISWKKSEPRILHERSLLLNENIDWLSACWQLTSQWYSVRAPERKASAKFSERNKKPPSLSPSLALSWPSEVPTLLARSSSGSIDVQKVFNKSTDRSRHDFAINFAPKPEKRINYFSSFGGGVSSWDSQADQHLLLLKLQRPREQSADTSPPSLLTWPDPLLTVGLMFDVLDIHCLCLRTVKWALSTQPSVAQPLLALYSALANSRNSKLKAGEFPECQLGECIGIM